MVLLINRKDVEGRITLTEAVRLMEDAFHEYAMNTGINHERVRLHYDYEKQTPNWSQLILNSFMAVLPGRGLAGFNVRSDYQRNYETRVDSVSPFKWDRSIFILYDARNASPLAMIYGGNDKQMPIEARQRSVSVPLRTAACVALGTKLLAREGSDVLGFFGAGFYAPIVMQAVCASIPSLGSAKVYSPTTERRTKFCQEMSKILGFDVRPVGMPLDAVKGSDVIITCTSSRNPVFDGEWLEAGTHVTTMLGANRAGYGFTRREIDDATHRRASVIVISNKRQAMSDDDANITDPISRGATSWDAVHELHELVAGSIPGRTRPDEITLFHNNAGQGIADLAIASKVYEIARKEGLGKELEF